MDVIAKVRGAGLQRCGPEVPSLERVLTPGALAFLTALQRQFGERRRELLGRRRERQNDLDAGLLPDFLEDTLGVRQAIWQVAPAPADLLDRRVEITGPVERKMMINALNSGASVFMADFEDALSPTWANVVAGQANCMDAVRRTLSYESPEGRRYELGERLATLLVRPRGWHLEEKHLLLDGEPLSASLVDFGLYLFHNATALLERQSGPYFYLPKLQSHFEARLWNDLFVFAQDALGIPQGTIRATVLIETILAVFEMDEILYELRDHAAGLNAGRWDYIFSTIKTFRADERMLLPDRSQVTMAVPFMAAYSDLLVRTCHERGAHAIGGMAAFIPSRRDAEINTQAIAQVTADKEREAEAGFDGTWVAHPDLVPVARAVFDRVLGDRPHQKERLRQDVHVSAGDLLDFASAKGAITEGGLRKNVDVGIRYLASWLAGTGAAAIDNLMEDAATAEISRAQVWQWIHHGAVLDDGRRVTADQVAGICREVRDGLLHDDRQTGSAQSGGDARVERAAALFEDLVTREDFVEFLTLSAYEVLD